MIPDHMILRASLAHMDEKELKHVIAVCELRCRELSEGMAMEKWDKRMWAAKEELEKRRNKI